MDIDVDQSAPRGTEMTKSEPATFRGVDCALLAERYVAYRRGKERDDAQDNLDVIRPAAAPSSENV